MCIRDSIYTDAIVKGLAADDAAKSETFRKDATHSVAVFGHRPPELGGYGENSVTLGIRRKLIEILRAKLEMQSDVQVLTGLGLGAEMLAAEAAAASATPYVVVLAIEGVELRWPDATQKRFQELLGGARSVTIASKENPKTGVEYAKVMGRRDDEILRRATEAVLIRNGDDRTLGDLQRKLERRFQDDVWIIDPQ